MKFKTRQIKRDYNDLNLKASPENILLRQFVEVIDTMSRLTGHGEVTITDYLRTNPRSLHHYGRALDLRTKDKSNSWYWAMSLLGLAFWAFSKQFRVQVHKELKDTKDQHIHIEIRDLKKN